MEQMLVSTLDALTSIIVALTRFIDATAPWSSYTILLAPPFVCLLCRRGRMTPLTLALSVGGVMGIAFVSSVGLIAILLSWILAGRVIYHRLRRSAPIAAA